MKFARVFIFALITTLIAAVFSWSQADAASKSRPVWVCNAPGACTAVDAAIHSPNKLWDGSKVVKGRAVWVFWIEKADSGTYYSAFLDPAVCEAARDSVVATNLANFAEKQPPTYSKVTKCRVSTAAAVLKGSAR